MTSFKSSSGSDASDVPTLSMETLASNPHEVYRHFRGELPFIRSEAGVYLVLRADDVLNLFSDAKTRQVETELITLRGVKDGPIRDFMTNGMLISNGDARRL